VYARIKALFKCIFVVERYQTMGIPVIEIESVVVDTISALKAATVLVPVWQTPAPVGGDESSQEDDNTVCRLDLTGWVSALTHDHDVPQWAKEDGFDASRGKTLVLKPVPQCQVTIKRIILVGMGEPAQLTRNKVGDPFESAIKTVLKLDESLHNMAVLLPAAYECNGGALANDTEHLDSIDTGTITLAVMDGLANALYRSKESKKPSKALPSVKLGVATAEAKTQVDAVLPLAHALITGRSLAKDLVNQPSNTKCTQTLVDAAEDLKAQFPGLQLTVINNPDEIAKEFPCFYSVALGSLASDPPKFIHLRYTGSSVKTKLAFVGKSVIFDTGGYQVKPGNSMVTMKGDMAGGASVLGALQVVAMMQPEHLQLDVYLAATPNRIDAGALVPDSILDTRCGKTVEMRHTDAEGRLTLIDGVCKAAEDKPDVIVTVATLTGAAMRAVGRSIALMGNHPRWEQKVLTAAQLAGDPVQPLAVTPEDYDDVKSKLDGADLRNTSKNENRGAQSAAAFVMSGAPKDMPCVHLDIAGADMTGDETATAYSVRTLAHLALMVG
jgi:leucyl aminopeptidase